MTLNPSAAHGLEACTEKQSRIHTSELGFGCPGGSKIGTVALNVPGLPEGSLKGNIYLGGPASGPITAPPYTMYVDAESERYGIAVRLKGLVTPNETTGRLTTTFSENPEQPFSNLTLTLHGRRARADRQPARLRDGKDRNNPHAVLGHGSNLAHERVHGRQQQQRRFLPVSAAVRSGAGHRGAARYRRRAQRVHVQPGTPV